jgi:hypothetical protein
MLATTYENDQERIKLEQDVNTQTSKCHNTVNCTQLTFSPALTYIQKYTIAIYIP